MYKNGNIYPKIETYSEKLNLIIISITLPSSPEFFKCKNLSAWHCTCLLFYKTWFQDHFCSRKKKKEKKEGNIFIFSKRDEITSIDNSFHSILAVTIYFTCITRVHHGYIQLTEIGTAQPPQPPSSSTHVPPPAPLGPVLSLDGGQHGQRAQLF